MDLDDVLMKIFKHEEITVEEYRFLIEDSERRMIWNAKREAYLECAQLADQVRSQYLNRYTDASPLYHTIAEEIRDLIVKRSEGKA